MDSISGRQDSHSNGKAAKLHFLQEGPGLWPLIIHDRHDLGPNVLELRVGLLEAVLHQQLVKLGICPLQVRVLLPASGKNPNQTRSTHSTHHVNACKKRPSRTASAMAALAFSALLW